MGQLNDALIVALAAGALAALTFGLAIYAVLAVGALRRAGKATDADIGEIERTLEAIGSKAEGATQTAHQARDTAAAANGVVDGLQISVGRLREAVAQAGLDLSSATEANKQAIHAAIAEVATLLQGVQVRLGNAERAAIDGGRVERIERALLVLARHVGRDAIVRSELDSAEAAPRPAEAASANALEVDAAPPSDSPSMLAPPAGEGDGEEAAPALGESSTEAGDRVLLSPAMPFGAFGEFFAKLLPGEPAR